MNSIPAPHLTAVALAYAAGVVVYPYVPEDTPLRPMVAFLLPTAALAMSALLGSLWQRDPVRPREPRLDDTYHAIVFRLVAFIAAVQGVVVIGLLERAQVVPHAVQPLLSRSVPILLGMALVAVGNLLPRMKPNVVIGIRTSRTLSDAAAWSRTNRIAGYVAVALGAALIVVGALMGPGPARAQAAGAAGLAAAAVLFRQADRAVRL
jgi:hypothetical protein